MANSVNECEHFREGSSQYLKGKDPSLEDLIQKLEANELYGFLIFAFWQTLLMAHLIILDGYSL